MNTPPLRILTYNIHKGFSQFNRRLMVHELREQLRMLGADIVFLQEVQGRNRRHAARLDNWPQEPQHDFLAEAVWQATAYGRNVIKSHGHHGNAILSRFPIAHVFNQDVTHLRFERRGLLHCIVQVDTLSKPLHCVCVHLSLFARSRRRQMDALTAYLERVTDPDTPLIIAGDFNDGRLADRLGLSEAIAGANGAPGRSFPARKPLLRLDRIYFRGFSVDCAQVHHGAAWSQISDHAALSATLRSAGGN